MIIEIIFKFNRVFNNSDYNFFQPPTMHLITHKNTEAKFLVTLVYKTYLMILCIHSSPLLINLFLVLVFEIPNNNNPLSNVQPFYPFLQEWTHVSLILQCKLSFGLYFQEIIKPI